MISTEAACDVVAAFQHFAKVETGDTLQDAGRPPHVVRYDDNRVTFVRFIDKFLYQELSGGEQQRVHLARVVCQLKSVATQEHKFLFLDEPVSNLDIRHQINTLRAVRDLLSPQTGAFVILHDLNLAAGFADRVVIIHNGRIVANDSTSRALKSETLRQVFDVDLKVSRHGKSVQVQHAYRNMA